ncbi:MAG: hypothetical protein HYU80_02525 [Candidatus Blackburnbacteria bacterium]|nr:hypothetical protein [Candidatus Blackburnbacteria bacterium]
MSSPKETLQDTISRVAQEAIKRDTYSTLKHETQRLVRLNKVRDFATGSPQTVVNSEVINSNECDAHYSTRWVLAFNDIEVRAIEKFSQGVVATQIRARFVEQKDEWSMYEVLPNGEVKDFEGKEANLGQLQEALGVVIFIRHTLDSQGRQ